jgi:hypothetical protein
VLKLSKIEHKHFEDAKSKILITIMLFIYKTTYYRTRLQHTVYIIPLALCTVGTVRNKFHRNSKLLNFHTALYTLMQIPVILNVFYIVRKFLTEEYKLLDMLDRNCFENQLNSFNSIPIYYSAS